MSATPPGATPATPGEVYELELRTESDAPYIGRIEGTLIVAEEQNSYFVYLTTDGRIIFHNDDDGHYTVVEKAEDLRDMLATEEAYIEAMATLEGETPIIDL